VKGLKFVPKHIEVPHFAILRRAFTMSAQMSKEPRRFAPLRESSDKTNNGAPKLKGIVFDVDGTLCEPQTYMFAQMRSAVSIPKTSDILDHIYALPATEQEVAMEKIRAVERAAMISQKAQPGLVALMDYVESKGLPKAICTRNFETPVMHLLSKFLSGKHFSPIITRDFRPPKPDPAGILHIAKSWGFVKEGTDEGDASQLIMVGDSVDDMTAGYRAGAATVLLVNEVNVSLVTHEHTDLVVLRLDELIEVLENGFVGRIGRGEEGGDTRGRAQDVLREDKGEKVMQN